MAEDDDMVREITIASLESLGYTVLGAGNGRQAVEIFYNSDTIDLLLTDMVMPGMGGKAVADQCREKTPAIPIIYMSGYPFDETLKELLDTRDAAFLAKPFTPNVLARKIREVLDRHN